MASEEALQLADWLVRGWGSTGRVGRRRFPGKETEPVVCVREPLCGLEAATVRGAGGWEVGGSSGLRTLCVSMLVYLEKSALS